MASKRTPKAAPSFTAADYSVSLAALIKAGTAIDKATANSAAAVNTWALASAVGLTVKALTLDTIKSQLIAATPLAMRKANVAGTGTDTDSLAACGNTLKGWFYALQRIERAAALERLVKGEAFNTVARSVGTVQKQAPGKRAKAANDKGPASTTTQKAESAAHVPSATPLSDIVTAMEKELKRLSVPALAKNYQSDIARAMAVLAKASAAVEAHLKAKATPKAKAA